MGQYSSLLTYFYANFNDPRRAASRKTLAKTPTSLVNWDTRLSPEFNPENAGTRARQQSREWRPRASTSLRLGVRKVDCEFAYINSSCFSSDGIDRNTAQVSGGERELRTTFLRPFERACLESLSMMAAYSSYDGIPAVSNPGTFLLFVSAVYLIVFSSAHEGHREFFQLLLFYTSGIDSEPISSGTSLAGNTS